MKQDWTATRESIRALHKTLDEVEYKLKSKPADIPDFLKGFQNAQKKSK